MSSLTGLNVLVTRPQAQQQSLCDAIEAGGGRAISLPLIEISPVSDASELEKIKTSIRSLDNYHLLIFISTNAASYGAQWINDYWPQFPIDVAVVAVGPTTARTVSALLDCKVISSDSGMTSEDLLKLPVFDDVSDKRIAIFRGSGGRELLADTLRSRGGEVDYIEVYRRTAIDYAREELLKLTEVNSINVLSITSSESLKQLLAILGDNKAELSLLPLLVPSSRLAEEARTCGFSSVINAMGADELSFIAALESLADKSE